jgi:hypothetical protein
LIGDVNLLVERKFHRVSRRFEFGFRRMDCWNHYASSGIDHIFDEPERVSFFLFGLSEKMLRKLRQRFHRKMGRYRIILQLCAELVSDLFVNGIDDFLTR